MGYQAAWYASPINLPERRNGAVQVRHRTIEDKTPIVGARQAYTRGLRPVTAKLKEPLRIHELIHDKHGLWMTDLPEELNQIAELMWLLSPSGRVLVGGLGLGIVAKTLAIRKGINKTALTVVENDADVIALCATPDYKIVHQDIAAFLREHSDPFDFYLLDTWQGTNESCWLETVMPLRRTIRNRWGSKPVVNCWAEDIMQGQVRRCLVGPNRYWKYERLPLMNERKADQFLANVGLPAWEKAYGGLI